MSHHLFIDFEALAQSPDAAPIELGAVLFNPETAEILSEFYRVVRPNPWLRKEDATLQWHAERGSFPFTDEREAQAIPLLNALLEFKAWVQILPVWESVFSWGSTYDFPILATASTLEQVAMPWHYAQQECARTVWRRAFGDRKHAPRPHHALKDCRAGVADLCEALKQLSSSLKPAGEQVTKLNESLKAIRDLCPGGEIGDPEADRLLSQIYDIASTAVASPSNDR